jgi:hypothetical protein
MIVSLVQGGIMCKFNGYNGIVAFVDLVLRPENSHIYFALQNIPEEKIGTLNTTEVTDPENNVSRIGCQICQITLIFSCD